MIASTQTNHPLASFTNERAIQPQQNARELICARLREAGLRSTQPRISIYTALTELNEPAPIEAIFRSIKNNSCDLVTVYRGLALFEELGLVQRSFSGNGTGLYELKREGAPSFVINDKASDRREILDRDLADELHKALQSVEKQLIARGHQKVSMRVEIQSVLPTANTNREAAQDPLGLSSNSRVQSTALI